MSWLIKSNRNLFAFLVMPLFLVACGGGGGGGGSSDTNSSSNGGNGGTSPTPAITQDTPFAFIQRNLVTETQAKTESFKQAISGQGARSPLDLLSPYQFNPGAKLITRSSLDVDGIDTDVLTSYFNSADYDVKDLNVSADGKFLIFAAHGPNNHPTDYTWNIYEYSFKTKTIRRIIADDAIANAGQDTNPTYALDGSIVFSSDRSAGNPNSPIDNIVDEEQKPYCYKVGPDEKPSLLHSMTNQGENILQLTYGRNHDTKPTTLKDGRVAFVRWTRTYSVIPNCPVADTSGSNKPAFSEFNDVFNMDYPKGLDLPPQWSHEKLCALAQSTPMGKVVASNHYRILRITVDGEKLEQLYKTVTLLGSDESFIEPDQLIQVEDGKLVTLLQHQYNAFMGGNVLQLQSPQAPVSDKVFGNFSPSTMMADKVDLYPSQTSVNGWYSAVWPYRDGTGRMLVSWSQCSAVSGGVSSFCKEGANEGDVSSKYGIWVVDLKKASRLPVVNAQKDTLYSELAISQPHVSLDFPYEPYDADFVDDLDTSRLICTEPVNTPPIANAGPDQQVLIGQTVALDGSKSSDVDGDALTYYWTITSPSETKAVITNNTTAMPSITIKEHGTYVIQLVVNDGKIDSLPDTVSLEVGNVKPVANAGVDQAGLPGNVFELNGSFSTDADGDPLTYRWRIASAPEGSTSELTGADTAKPTITPDQYGVYTLELIVNDGYVDSDPDTVVIDTSNAAPIANAGPDQQVVIGQTATLNGSGSVDPDGDALIYYWTIISPSNTTAVLSSNTAVMPTLEIKEHGTYVVQLVVNDGKFDSAPDTVNLVVVNTKPVANAGANQNAKPGDQVQLDGSLSRDQDGDALTYRWRVVSAPSGSTAQIIGDTTFIPAFTPDQYGMYTIELIVNDGYVDSEPDLMVIDASNAAPIANAGADQSVKVGQTVTLDGSKSSDADGDPLTYLWTIISPSNTVAVITNNTSVAPSIVIKEHGTYVLQLIVNDGKTDSAPDTVSLTVDNTKPVANAGVDQTAEPGSQVQLDGSLSKDDDGDQLTYRWRIVSAPEGSTAALAGADSVNPTLTTDQYGMYTIELIVNDGYIDSEPDLMVIDASNAAPVANAGADQAVKVGQTVTLDGSKSSDADGDPLTYLWTIVSPSNTVAVITNNTSAAPTIEIKEQGAYVIQLVVNDGKVDSAPDTVSLTVENTKPVANAGADKVADPGSLVQLDGSLSKDDDGDQLTYRWRIVSAPEGSTAELAGADGVNPALTTDAYGMYTVELIVNDGYVDSDADTVVIDASNARPIANAGNDLDVYIDHTVTLDGSKSSDPDSDPITYLWTIISPSNTTTTIANNTAVMPSITIREHGTYVVQLVVNDGKVNSEPDTVTLTVVNSKPIANAGPDQSGKPGDLLQLDGSLSRDADKDPLTYRWRIVSAPENSTAELVGNESVKPNFTPDQYGSYTIELIVNDGKVDSNADTMVIDTSNAIPVANAGVDQQVSKGQLVTLDGSGSSDADGDALTYHWTIISPANTQAVLSDSSAVMPTLTIKEHGIYVVQLVVNDGKSDSAPDTVSLEVGNVKPVANAGVDQNNDPGNQLQLDGSLSSDVDGDTLHYSWRIVSAPDNSVAAIVGADTVNPTITPDQYGIYTIELVVNDGVVDSDPDTMVINTLNARPVADAGRDQSVRVGDVATLNGTNSTDADGDPLTYTWSILSKPLNSSAALNDPAIGTPAVNIDKAGSYVIQLIVNDGIQDSEPDTVILTTTNVRPVAEAGTQQTKYVGDGVSLNGSESYDPDGDNINYRWALTTKPAGSIATLVNDAAVNPQFTADKEGTYVAQLIVNDGALDSLPDTVTIKIEQPACDISSATRRTLPVTIRDFDTRHPDFETYDGVETGIVKKTLGYLSEGGKPVYARDTGGSKTTTGKFYFDQWYRDVPDVNINIPYTLQMERQAGSTVWSYINSDFFPINDQGFGNYKNNRNFHFTMEAHLEFDYVGGEVFTFRGDDDLWVFINGKLAIDIGGVHGVEERTIRLNDKAAELGIEKGKTYRFDLFFAERHTWKSNFMFQTNINLECVPGQQ